MTSINASPKKKMKIPKMRPKNLDSHIYMPLSLLLGKYLFRAQFKNIMPPIRHVQNIPCITQYILTFLSKFYEECYLLKWYKSCTLYAPLLTFGFK